MKFWDTSAIVPLLTYEKATAAMQGLYRDDPDLFVWWGTEVECVSAVARVEREGGLSTKAAAEVLQRLRQLTDTWNEIRPVTAVRAVAVRFLRVHNLRAADALQLAAAFLAAETKPATLNFVTLDQRLADAARKEGFGVIDNTIGRLGDVVS